MADISYSRILAGDTELLDEVIGYHCRLIQSDAMQLELMHVSNRDVLETLARGRPLMAFYDQIIHTFQRCLKDGAVIGAWEDGHRLVGYTAYSTAIGHMLNITHRPEAPVALINFFRVPNRKNGDIAKGLAVELLDDLRGARIYPRLGFATGTATHNQLSLEDVLQPIAMGFDNYGRFRVAGLNAADISMGIYRRPANMKGPSFWAPGWKL